MDSSGYEYSLAYKIEPLAVRFVELPDKYPPNEDLVCKYTCTKYKVQEGDRIAVFKMGWSSLKNYVLFEWAIDSSLPINSVNFSKYDLPSSPDIDELYQFCYISVDNVVQGISKPFQISSGESKPINMTDSLKQEKQCSHLRDVLSLKDQEILKLKEENAILKESLKAVVEQRKAQGSKNYDNEIIELRSLTDALKCLVMAQQQEMQSMKSDFKKHNNEVKQLILEKFQQKNVEPIVVPRINGTKKVNFDLDLGSLPPLPPFPFDIKL